MNDIKILLADNLSSKLQWKKHVIIIGVSKTVVICFGKSRDTHHFENQGILPLQYVQVPTRQLALHKPELLCVKLEDPSISISKPSLVVILRIFFTAGSLVKSKRKFGSYEGNEVAGFFAFSQ